LKLSADEFFDLTPKQLDAMLKRHKSSLESPEFMLAQIVSALYNTGFKSPEKPTSPLDFMLSQQGKKKSTKTADPTNPVRMTKKRRQALMDQLNATLGIIARKA
jgi:hypothetical protein